jgi:hypothetical protein
LNQNSLFGLDLEKVFFAPGLKIVLQHYRPEAAVRCNATILPVLEKRTSRRHHQTDARLTYRCIWTAKNDDRFDPEAEVDERCLPMSIYELTG